MKKILYILLFSTNILFAQSTIILPGGNNSNIQLSGSKNGITISGLTTVERDAIQNPSVGYTIYNKTSSCIEFYNGVKWNNLCENQTLSQNSTYQEKFNSLISAGWKYKTSYNGHDYFQWSNKLTWQQAQSLCIQYGGSLMCINSSEENEKVAKPLTSSISYGDFHLGLYQNTQSPSYQEPNGGWEWVDKSEYSYSNWNIGEPNNSGGDENYVMLDYNNIDDKWNDIGTGTTGNVIMEIGIKPNTIWTVSSYGPSNGFIFYDKGNYSNGWRYLESAPNDIEMSSWGCPDFSITAATNISIGSGLSNSLAIVNSCNTSNIAAKRCLDYTINGFDNWFLPSQQEFALIYTNLIKLGIGNFASQPIPSMGTLYWTSTQLTSGSASHFCKECDGNFYQYSKVYSLYVRPVRMF